MKKLLTLTTAALLASTSAQAASGEYDYGADMYEQDTRAERVFDRLDLNNDGEVTINEYNALLNVGDHDRPVTTSFQDMDIDNSGVITRDEAEEYTVGMTTTSDRKMKKHKHNHKHKHMKNMDKQADADVYVRGYDVDVDLERQKRMDVKKTNRTSNADAASYRVEGDVKTRTYNLND